MRQMPKLFLFITKDINFTCLSSSCLEKENVFNRT
jgi:hypothetical protein